MTSPPITAATVDDLALTKKEQAQWMLHRLTPGQGICNLGMALRTDQQLRWWPVQETLNHILRRHKALRATLHLGGATARKRYLPEDTEFPLETLTTTDDEADAELSRATAPPFDVDGQLLIRAHLILTPTHSVLSVVAHHLVCDYTSFTVLLAEFADLYDAFAAGDPPPAHLAGAAPMFVETDPEQSTVDYWVAHLDGADPAAMALAGARPIVGRPTFAGAIIDHRLSPEADAAVETLRARTRLTRNLVMLAVFYAVLAKHGAGPDLVVGVPVNARRGPARDAVGFHANTLPIRVHVDPDIDVVELARRTSHAFLVGLENGSASFEAVQFALGNRSADWRTPLFRHMFNFRPVGRQQPAAAGRALRGLDLRRALSRLDVEWEVWPKPKGTEIYARYSTEVHDQESMQTLLRRYEALLIELAASGTGTPIGSVTGWTAADAATMAAVNDTAREWPAGTVLDEVADTAARQPAAVAVRGERSVGYAELLGAAGGVAEGLRANGIRPGDVVGVYATRGPQLAAAVLGVWSAGAAYLPFDPGHPAGRVTEQLADAGATVVLAGMPLPAECAAGRTELDLAALCARHAPLAGVRPGLADLAYVIYTSGSTGSPKGVEITHGNLANVVRHFAAELDLSPTDRMLWLTTYSFDISALELLVPLVSGATVVVAPDESRLRAADLLRVIEDEGVTVVQATPTTWRHLAPELAGRLGGCRLLTGGEAVTGPLADTLLDHDRRLLNVYGPTETTIWSTSARAHRPVPDRVPIGLPIANTTVHILDQAGYPVPPGVPGELCVGGAGVARGYRDRPELTAERFRDDPALGRYYRTGDVVRLGPAGLEFLGRDDRQVKVRGHRIELGEVEAVLEEHPAVLAAAVVVAPDPGGDNRLVAAIRPAPAAGDDLPERLHAHASARLASAAVPAAFAVLDEFPLTGNGKVDNTALVALLSGADEETALPDDPLLRTLVLAWRTVLGADHLGPDANFFLSGGHSLLAAKLADHVATELATDVDLTVVFAAPTPRKLADVLRAGGV